MLCNEAHLPHTEVYGILLPCNIYLFQSLLIQWFEFGDSYICTIFRVDLIWLIFIFSYLFLGYKTIAILTILLTFVILKEFKQTPDKNNYFYISLFWGVRLKITKKVSHAPSKMQIFQTMLFFTHLFWPSKFETSMVINAFKCT